MNRDLQTKRCKTCKTYLPEESFSSSNWKLTAHLGPRCKSCVHICNRASYLRNRETRIKSMAIYRRALKTAVFTVYGNVCACCGETEPAFLAIDHIAGGGNKHRKEVGIGSTYTFYSWLRKNNYPTGFQVLCHNCNMGKSLNGGMCPHERNNLEGF